ncbi:MAG: metallopeptidase family protein [Syntrophomonas sp.]
MAKPSFNEFTDMLDSALIRIPPQYCRKLTGGFNVQKGKKLEEEYYILGEYVEGGQLGCFIVFYYGSFAGLLEDEPREAWEAEIMDTVLHELQHHLESLAGRDDLARQEIEELNKALREKI